MFTEENKPLLEKAASIDFQFMKDGAIAYRKHTKHELGLYFIKQAIEKHGNTYGYSKVNYVNNITKVILQCEKHGPFEQTPHSHLRGRACPKCANLLKMSTTEDFIKRALDIHGNKYDYSETKYTGARNKVTVICEKHGRYSILASNHLSGSGCAQCAGKYSPTTEEFIEKARDVHGDKYDYSSVHYKGSQEKIEIFCPIPNHGTFFQTPSNHLSFNGCPICAGKKHNILYLLKCLETGWYKIGITTDSVQKRIVSLGGNIETVHHVILEDPRKHESILHKRYENAREFNLFVRNGNTEFFSLTESQTQEIIKYMNEVSSNA